MAVEEGKLQVGVKDEYLDTTVVEQTDGPGCTPRGCVYWRPSSSRQSFGGRQTLTQRLAILGW